MKRFDVKAETVIGGNRYFIRPFPAFVAVNLSAKLGEVIVPVIGPILPSIAEQMKKQLKAGEVDIVDMDIDEETIASALEKGLSLALTGDRLETLLKTMLTDHGNVSVQRNGNNDAEALTEDLASELFCGEIDGMFTLAWKVIKVNYGGFFGKLGSPSGKELVNRLLRGKSSLSDTAS